MLILVVVLLAVWLIVSTVGFAMEGLMRLGIVGVVLFIGTAVIGGVRRKSLRRPSARCTGSPARGLTGVLRAGCEYSARGIIQP